MQNSAGSAVLVDAVSACPALNGLMKQEHQHLMLLCTQVEIREGWPRDRSAAQRLPFEEDQWRRRLLKSIIGHLGKAPNVMRVIKLTEHAMDGAWLPFLCRSSQNMIHGLLSSTPPEACMVIRTSTSL